MVMIVMVPTMGKMMGFAAPTSIPPLATTSAISPPDEDSPTAVRADVILLILCNLEDE